MNGPEVLRIVDAMHRDKNIPKDIIFDGIESALMLAARKHFNEAEDILIQIDRGTGNIIAKKGDVDIDPQILGRIAAQSAKQVMIQKIREAECTSVYDDFINKRGELVTGTIQRIENGSALVTIGTKTEAFLPRSEMIPGESPHIGQRIKAIILDVRKMGNRVRIVLSRTHPDFVRRLFEQEIPEIADRTIALKSVAREAGYRTKIAASSIDQKVDAVGACVGVRGSRIKNIIDELGGERIDIVRWNESLQVMIPNALQPAVIEEIMLYPRLGRAIVLVKEDQLSLAIGRRGQNVRLASKLVGWDIEIMTAEELAESIERAEEWFRMLPNVTDELVERFIEEGFLSYDDLTFMEPADMTELFGLTEEQAETLIAVAEQAAEAVEQAKQEAAAAKEAAEAEAALSEGESAEGEGETAGTSERMADNENETAVSGVADSEQSTEESQMESSDSEPPASEEVPIEATEAVESERTDPEAN